MAEHEPHDVFISYARAEAEWVRTNLYEPLLQCRTASGRPPRIFFDTGEHGIQHGQGFLTVIAEAVKIARKVVPVYSSIYFSSEMCQLELELAQTRDVVGKRKILLPIVRDGTRPENFPFAVSMIQYRSCSEPDWFAKLAQALELSPCAEVLSLQFLKQPTDVFANHTLPVIRISVGNSQGVAVPYDEEITIRCDEAPLHGTTRKRTQAGVAVFDDLSLENATAEAHLTATAATLGTAVSEPFVVHARMASTTPVAQATHIRAAGHIVFLAHSRAIAVIQADRVQLFDLEGNSLMPAPMPLQGRVRLIRRRDRLLLLADWSGNVSLLRDDGRFCQRSFGSAADAFTIPADATLTDDVAFLAFWNGSVFRWQFDAEPTLVVRDRAGVQVLGVQGSRLFTCDFAGNLRTYRDGRLVNSHAVESVMWHLRATDANLLAVGERKFYHIAHNAARVADFSMPLGEISSVFEATELPIAIDVNGKGIRFDADFIIHRGFVTKPGAEPIAADNAGDWCVFHNPDGGCTLLYRDRIVFSHDDFLAVSPDGAWFALCKGQNIELFDQAAFAGVINQGAPGGAKARERGVRA